MFATRGRLARVLGVDPGLTRCGIGVVEAGAGNQLRLVYVGVLRTAPDHDLAQRLAALSRGLAGCLRDWEPQAVAVEQVFSQHNVRTVMGTAQVAGVALSLAGLAGLPVGLHTPTEVKAAVTGHGRAGKAQVGAMVQRLLGLTQAPAPADALALAICHLWRAPLGERVSAS
ncbi:MAG: crossover junction endodeoxyribonuclease RuvC [Mycobacteriales bacterium]